jgi:hypothetical protein
MYANGNPHLSESFIWNKYFMPSQDEINRSISAFATKLGGVRK